jgi:cephalosporin hydroxylase
MRLVDIQHGTDKIVYHGYGNMYEALFDKVRFDVKNVLEIGVQYGYSLLMWQDYFPNAIIHGIELNLQKQVVGDRIKVYIGDGTDEKFLTDTFKDMKFDIIVDDGSHRHDHQNMSLAVLQNYLVPGGYYIIEDIPPEKPDHNTVTWLNPNSLLLVGLVCPQANNEQMLILRKNW